MVLATLLFKISAVFHHVAAIQETHTEFRKFDDMLRMVIDCTTDQANAIEFCLRDKYEHGMRLFYGIHYSSHSIVTCIAEDVADGTHVHLIDGDEGGYARAGEMLKAQLDKASKQDFRSSNVHHQQILTNVLEDHDDDIKMDFQMETHPHQSFDLELPSEMFYQSTSAAIPSFREDEETGGMSSVDRDFGDQIDSYYGNRDDTGGFPLLQEETVPPSSAVAQIEEVESLKKPKKHKSKKKKKKTSNSSSEMTDMAAPVGTFDLPPNQLQEVSDLAPGMNDASFMQESSGMIGESSQVMMKGESSDKKPKKRKKEKSKKKKKSKSRSSTTSSSLSLVMSSSEKAPSHALSISTASTTRMTSQRSGNLLDGNDSSSLG